MNHDRRSNKIALPARRTTEIWKCERRKAAENAELVMSPFALHPIMIPMAIAAAA
jgi:hypothetical protein